MKRFFQQRGIKKLLRDRMAVISMAAIGVYALFAVAIGWPFQLIERGETIERVGPSTLPGLWTSPTPEKRLENVSFYLETLDSAFESQSPEETLREVGYAELRLAEGSVEEIAALHQEGWTLYDRAAEIESIESEEGLAALEEAEEHLESLFPAPGGFGGFTYKLRTMLGTDRQGRSIMMRGLYATKVAIQIGAVSALIAVLLGSLLGGIAGYFGGVVDHAVVWLYSTFSSIPWIVLLMVLAATFREFADGKYDGTLIPVYAAFCTTFWISPCRVIRGEVMKLRELEYVQAASAVGYGRLRILMRHVLPNTAHLMFINFSLLFIGAIKAEVILSFLGLGVKNEPSWGVMINHSQQEVINGFFWQIGTATALMVGLVLAFNTLSDALQDAFDPKHVN